MKPLDYFKIIAFKKKVSNKKFDKMGYQKLGHAYDKNNKMHIYCVIDLRQMIETTILEA